MRNKKLIGKADAVIILSVILAALIFFAFSFSGTPSSAQIITDGEVVLTVDFSEETEPRTVDLGNGVVILIEKDGICFSQSDCRSQECVRCGVLKNAGDTAVCIPNKTVIKLTGRKGNSPDAVSY